MPRPKDTGLGSSGYDSDFYKVERRPGKPNKLVLDEQAYRRQYGAKNPRDRFVDNFTREYIATYDHGPIDSSSSMLRERLQKSSKDNPAHETIMQELARKKKVEKKTGLVAPEVNDKGSKSKPVTDEHDATVRRRNVDYRGIGSRPEYLRKYPLFMGIKQNASTEKETPSKQNSNGAANSSNSMTKSTATKPAQKPAAKSAASKPAPKPAAKPAAKPASSSKPAPAKKK